MSAAEVSAIEDDVTVEIYMSVGHSRDQDVDTESEAFDIARDLRCAGTDAFEEFDLDPQHAVDEGLDRIGEPATLPGDDFDDVDELLEFVYKTCQGPTVSASLPYDGSETRSMTVGDVIVVDGTPHMVDRFGFEELDVDLGDGDDDSPTLAAERFPSDDVEINPGDFVWIDSGAVNSHSELGEGGSQGCDVVDVDGDGLTVEYPRHGDTETATISRDHVRETDLKKWDRVEISYDSVYTDDDAPRVEKAATVLHVRRGRGFEGIVVETEDGSEYQIASTGDVRTRGETRRVIGRDARVDGVIAREADDSTVGCVCCGFGYDGDEHDTCPVCASGDCPNCDGEDGEDDPEVAADGGWISEADGAEFCKECQRRRISCAHRNAVETDGGVEYTDLQAFAARLSGKLSLDARAVPDLGAAAIVASEPCLRDNCDRLRREGYDAEVDDGHDPTRLLVYPDDQREALPDGGRERPALPEPDWTTDHDVAAAVEDVAPDVGTAPTGEWTS